MVKLTMEPVTRIEGHAKITVHLDEAGNVEDTRLHVMEFRGFEKFLQGRPAEEVPRIVPRICGICDVQHHSGRNRLKYVLEQVLFRKRIQLT